MKKQLVSMTIDADLWVRIKTEAKARGLSASAFIRMLVLDYFSSKEG